MLEKHLCVYIQVRTKGGGGGGGGLVPLNIFKPSSDFFC